LTGRGTEDGSVLLTIVKSAALFAAAAAANAGRRMAATLAGYLFAGGLFAVGLCFLTLAGYRAIAQPLGDVYAALIVGCLYLVAGLVAMLILQLKRR
jgi:quinol-cytochrome oxidoreductase complex cytochrome b subunit